MKADQYAGRAAEAAARAKANVAHNNYKWTTLNVAHRTMYNEHGEYTGMLQYVPADVGEAIFKALQDVELLARVNAPITDGSAMHKTIKKAIAAAIKGESGIGPEAERRIRASKGGNHMTEKSQRIHDMIQTFDIGRISNELTVSRILDILQAMNERMDEIEHDKNAVTEKHN